mgnify:CR=1 FL=1
METIRVKFVDFWPGFDEKSNFFTNSLSDKYNIEYVSQDPDYLVYSCFGDQHKNYTSFDCVKIFYTGENVVPDFNACDYALGFDHLEFGERYLRYPLFGTHGGFEAVNNRLPISQQDVDKRTRFCNFVYSNWRAAPIRDQIFKKLSAYKQVESAGKYLRNVRVEGASITSGRGAPNDFNKIELQKNYRFSIAFENSEHDGYSTEKIMDAFTARTLPIYWGNPLVLRDINPESFINAYDFETMDDLVQEVIRIDTDPTAYLEMINAPVFTDELLAQPSFRDQGKAFLEQIVAQPLDKARKRPKAGNARRVETVLAAKQGNVLQQLVKRWKQTKPASDVSGYDKIR